ncbi:MAG: NUDIX hydrolase [bacterium]|nr:NUDIX hydrolase [bacterium]
METNNQEKYLQVGVKVILKNEKEEVLLLRRNPKKYPEIGPTWDIVGGRINVGIPLIENLKREVMEETGLKITSEPRLIYAQDIMGIERFPGRHVVRLTYVATTEGEPTIDEESLEYQWVPVSELDNIEQLDKFLKEVLEKTELN